MSATKTAESTRLKFTLIRSGVYEHHDFEIEVPEGVTPKDFLDSLEEHELEDLWQSYRRRRTPLDESDVIYGPKDSFDESFEARIVDHEESETHYDGMSTEIRWDCLRGDNPHINFDA